MRPLRLEFQALGAFPGKVEIDFDALGQRGLFVVSGDTGTGKTTIFDAMCFALYGDMPSKQKGEIRSHHVEPGVETYVVFEFESGDKRYRVRRRPEHPTSPKQQAASIECVTEGDGTKSVETQWKRVSDACVRIVGLDAQQFMRVVLLPQGEFAQFLFANSGEREALLKNLFGGEIFQRLVDELKERAKEARDRRDHTKVKVEERIKGLWNQVQDAHQKLALEVPGPWGGEPNPEAYDHEGAEAMLVELQEHVRRAGEQVAAAQAEEETAQKAKKSADDAAERFDDFARATERQKELEAQRTEVDQQRTAAEASGRARPVVNAAANVEEWTKKYGDATQKLESRFQRIENDLTIAERSVTAVNAAVSALRDEIKGQSERLEQEQDARKKRDEAASVLEVADAAVQEAEEKLQKWNAAIADFEGKPHDPSVLKLDLNRLEQELSVAADRLKAKKRLEKLLPELKKATQARDAAEAERRQAWEAFVDTQAPRLAKELQDGEPCPVCGSIEHPQPAQAGDVGSIDIEAVNTKQEIVDIQEQRRLELKDQCTQLEIELGDSALATVQELESCAEQAKTAYGRQQLAVDAAERILNELASAKTEATQWGKEHSSATKAQELARKDLGEAEQRLAEAEKDAADIDPEEVKAGEARLQRAVDAQQGLEDLGRQVTSAQASLDAAKKRLKEARQASQFESEEAAKDAVLTEEQEFEFRKRAGDFDTSWTKCEAEFERLEKEGVPEERPDTEAASAQLQRAVEKRRTLTSSLDVGGAAVAAVQQRLESLEQGTNELAEATAAHGEIDKVATVCQRGGGLRMPLPRWALAHELDRVTAAGNVHLDRMTSGRYALRRCAEPRDGRRPEGLELEVLDAHTGKPRSTKSLSGGEQFQASLALALGLADVVSQGGTSSGRSFEALFVDEGFGSLDPRALDEAVEALHQIQASGRMVGAITHVEAMKQQLHVGIEVRRRDDGAGSVLRVHT